MTASVFAYGTLQLPSVMEAVTGKQFKSAAAVLEDYARFVIRKQVYPGIIPAGGATVNGRIYFDLEQSVIDVLDAFEDILYDRKCVDVTCNNKKIKTQAYVVNNKFRNLLGDEPWCIDIFQKKHLTLYLESCRKFHFAYLQSQKI